MKNESESLWITWELDGDTMMEARDPAKHGCGILIYKANNTVQVAFAEAGQIRRDCPSATRDNPKNRRANVELDDNFAFVARLMKLQEQGIDFAALASDPHSENSHRHLVNVFAADAWRLLAMVASGGDKELTKLLRSITQCRELRSDKTGGRVKQLYEVADSLARIAECKWKRTGQITPPTKTEVEKQRREDKHGKLDKGKIDLRESLWHMGFGWLIKP
ncbi:MAG: hypothetical protein RLZZ553_847 [Verrucomicrobiota bacterium]|jgi:hypothetical protein